MILSRQTTPWARDRLTVGEREAIANAEPFDAYVNLGYSRGWTCRITDGSSILGEVYHEESPMRAFRAAQDVIYRDDIDEEWTNREGMPEFSGQWSRHDG